MFKIARRKFGCSVAAVLWSAFALSVAASAQTFVRTQIHPVQTIAITTEQFLTGDTSGKSEYIAGELRIPGPAAATNKLPTVILIPGGGGPITPTDRWAQDLQSIGIATFILDPFAGRRRLTLADQFQLNTRATVVDAYRALALLADNPRVDPTRIAVMGFSLSGVAGLYTSVARFAKMYGHPSVQFAAHIALYPPCNITYRDDTKTTGKPIRLFHGSADDWLPVDACRSYVERLKGAGADVALMEFPGAHHAYDFAHFPTPIPFPAAATLRKCVLEEGDNGRIMNSATGKAFDANDPCIERGPHSGYNAAAHQGTVKAVQEFLREKFSLQ